MVSCKPAADLLTQKRSSAQSRQLWEDSPIWTGSQDWSNIFDMLLTNKLNNKGEFASPCNKPIVLQKGWHKPSVSFT